MVGKTRPQCLSTAPSRSLRNEPVFQKQLLYSSDYWRARIPRSLGLDVVANHGIAIGDVNGDGLEDIYLCQQGGLPNRLFIRNEDGTLTDKSGESGANWLDYSASALLIDLDNDGDRDLAVALEWKVLFMENDGQGHFTMRLGFASPSQLFSMSAADFDSDAKLDIYICGYNPIETANTRGAMGSPMPFHDANNGGENGLFRNVGDWKFRNVTRQVGLDQNNTRFSFAASWEDFDEDGDPDLYVANDYGRNNLFRNDGGKFTDIAAIAGVEDISAGMSTSWGDFNRDGKMDLYVSNMFSSAGNRITFQRQFQPNASNEARSALRRHARGNTLFQNNGDGTFLDRSVDMNITMGRWAWGSRWVDFNNDGWEDILVANGYITTEDTGDL